MICWQCMCHLLRWCHSNSEGLIILLDVHRTTYGISVNEDVVVHKGMKTCFWWNNIFGPARLHTRHMEWVFDADCRGSDMLCRLFWRLVRGCFDLCLLILQIISLSLMLVIRLADYSSLFRFCSFIAYYAVVIFTHPAWLHATK